MNGRFRPSSFMINGGTVVMMTAFTANGYIRAIRSPCASPGHFGAGMLALVMRETQEMAKGRISAGHDSGNWIRSLDAGVFRCRCSSLPRHRPPTVGHHRNGSDRLRPDPNGIAGRQARRRSTQGHRGETGSAAMTTAASFR